MESEDALQKQMLWVLRTLNSEDEVSTEDLRQRLDSTAFEVGGVEEVQNVLNESLRPFKPFTITAFDGYGADGIAELRNRFGMLVNLEMSVNAEGSIQLLMIGPAAANRKPVTSLKEISEQLGNIADNTSFLVQKSTNDEVEDIFELNSSVERPMASVFKLYVLGAIAEAIRETDLTWDSCLTLTEQTKSLPTGELQEEPNGTQVTVLEAAELMIRISDNTATDLLMEAAGQDRLAQAVQNLGHADPTLLAPFPTTKNMFQMTLGGNLSLSEQWRAGSVSERTSLIIDLSAGSIEVDMNWEDRAPFWPDGLDWFGSVVDITEAHRGLNELSLNDPLLRQVLDQAKDGNEVREVDEKWVRYSQKTGSSPGAVAVSILAADSNGNVYSIAAQGSVTGDISEIELRKSEFIHLVEDALALAAK